MENNLFLLKIISADGKEETGHYQLVNVTLTDGEVGIMKDHLPLVGIITDSNLICYGKETIKKYHLSGGILNVGDEVIVLTDSFNEV